MRIVLTADHAGVDLKDDLAGWLKEQGHDVLDLGTFSHESVDYPRYGVMLAEALADGRAERGSRSAAPESASPLPPTATRPAAARKSPSHCPRPLPASTMTPTPLRSARA